jgi:lipopolysaccharide/colanic/teichoic acid biosynthesis glycosyltransferase
MPPQPESIQIVAEHSPAPRSGLLHRAFDVSCAVCGLLFLLPLFFVIAVAIKLDDGGPVFYRQNRAGRNFRNFRLWKFRSMITNADSFGLLTAPEDSRVTRTGRWLRRHKLDELPQLFNVVTGDMQLVGARPEVERYVEMFRLQYAIVLQDRPGITDPATLAYRHEELLFSTPQISQQYIETILPAKLRLSLEYQFRRTFGSDLRIILQTIFG